MMDNDGKGISWRVTSQQEKAGQGPDGRYGPGVEIAFQMANGQSGTVFVPNTLLTADNARRMINEKVDQIAAIGGLSS